MKKIIIITSGFAFSALLLLAFIIGRESFKAQKSNAFLRRWIDSINISEEYRIDSSFFSICGFTDSKIFASGNVHGNIIELDHKLNLLDSIKISLPQNKLLISSYELKVDSPEINVYAKNFGTVLKYRIGDSSMVGWTKLMTTLLTRVINISTTTIAIRGFDSTRKYQLFQKLDINSGKILAKNDILETQYDAGFSSDGIFLFDNASYSLLYIQFYQNKFYCLDTNLNLIYTGKTIDTVSNNPVQTKKILAEDSSGSLMPSVPLKAINHSAISFQGKLYIVSALRSDNETTDEFKNSTPIDVYQISNGSYIGSFRVPNMNNRRVSKIEILDRKLLALYKGCLVSYSFNNFLTNASISPVARTP